MKESLYHIDNRCVFRETFNDEFTVRKNGRVSTNVSFKNGIANFNGVSSRIVCNGILLNGTYSIRIKVKDITLSNQYLCDFRLNSGTGYIHLLQNGNFDMSSGTTYSNGSLSSTYSTSTTELVISGITVDVTQISIGRRYTADFEYFFGGMDLFEIYKGALTAEEVSLLYNGKVDKELNTGTTLLDYQSTNGVIENSGKQSELTPTDVEVVKNGSFYTSKFNGSSSNISIGVIDNTGNRTFTGWINPYSLGENNAGHIYSDQDYNNLYLSSGKLKLNRNGSPSVAESSDIEFNKMLFFAITSTSTGVTNIYIGDKNTAPVLSGSADQEVGSPIASSTVTYIGNRHAGDRAFDGLIPKLRIEEGILSLEQITQHWAETRKEVM
ncbi:MAG TPA: LamG-like jellyroll fold domain-containing protein [Halanaerobiales bacterium]|nr:LamG-like jellyroll fold domain-containing protein [Halanaerobiales bacterium]